MNEREFQRQIVAIARKFGWLVYHTFDSRKSSPGFPDLVMVKPPRVLFAELKTNKGKLSKEQDRWLQEIADSEKVSAHIWRPVDMDEVIEFLAV